MNPSSHSGMILAFKAKEHLRGCSARTFGGSLTWAWRAGLAGAAVLGAGELGAQELFRPALPREAALEAREIRPESLPYTFKAGDFRLLVTPSLEVDWVDNVNLSRNNAVHDFILRPLMQFDGSYPLTVRNLLQFKVGVGYDLYLDHSEF